MIQDQPFHTEAHWNCTSGTRDNSKTEVLCQFESFPTSFVCPLKSLSSPNISHFITHKAQLIVLLISE